MDVDGPARVIRVVDRHREQYRLAASVGRTRGSWRCINRRAGRGARERCGDGLRRGERHWRADRRGLHHRDLERVRIFVDRPRSCIDANPNDAPQEDIPDCPAFEIRRNSERGFLPSRFGAANLNVFPALFD